MHNGLSILIGGVEERMQAVIDRTYPLGQAGEAIRHLADGEPVGRVVLTV